MSPSSAYALRPWTDVVRPHDDIRSGDLALGTYAANLAQVAMTHEAAPVYGDAEAFFAATYFTPTMCGLLADVFGALAGQRGDRVVQLKTPFGGGKTHSLLALFHLARSRAAAASVPELDEVADPGGVRIAVLSGEYLDPARGREVEGRVIRTLWGELAFQIGGWSAYERLLVDGNEGPPPAGQRLGELLTGSPALVLLDEVLVYAAKAKSLRIGDSTMDRQVLLFLQHLTEAVNQQQHAALVYSLQASVGEAVGEEGLLEALEKIAGRIDERREPVSGDEVLRVVQRRLFADVGDDSVRTEVARAYGDLLAAQLAAAAETDGDQQEAAAAGRGLEQRILESYPFHPELLDLMFHRWGSLPTYQRTRGALQFLATVVHALWAKRSEREPQPLIGPGDVDLADEGSRLTFLEQVGATNQYASVVQADFLATDAGTRRIDERLGRDAPGLERARVGTRVATAIMLLSFGAREGSERGALERDVLESSLAPGLDRNVLLGALEALRGEALLFLHHVGGRYRFEPQPNLNRLIQQETANVSREDVQNHVRARLEDVLGARGSSRHVVLWPDSPGQVPDATDAFQVVYLPTDWSTDQNALSRYVLESANGPRVARNALAFVEPAPGRFDDARAAARRALAVEALLTQGSRIGLSTEQKDELGDRLRTSEQELRSALAQAYTSVQVPLGLADDGTVRFATRDLGTILAGGRALHERVREALQTYVADELFPSKISALADLGEEREWRWIGEVAHALPRFFEAPKVWTPAALSAGVAKAVAQGSLGYVAGAQERDGELTLPSPSSVRLRDELDPENVGLGEGCALLRVGLAERLRTPPTTAIAPVAADPSAPTAAELHDDPGQLPIPLAPGSDATGLSLSIAATENDLFTLSQALGKLRGLLGEGGTMQLQVEVRSSTAGEPIDRLRVRNTVVEPMEEDQDITLQWQWTGQERCGAHVVWPRSPRSARCSTPGQNRSVGLRTAFQAAGSIFVNGATGSNLKLP